MTSSNGNIFRVNGHFCGEFTGPRWIPRTKALMFSLICVWINDWVNNREAGDLRRYRAHYDVIVMDVIVMAHSVHVTIAVRCTSVRYKYWWTCHMGLGSFLCWATGDSMYYVCVTLPVNHWHLDCLINSLSRPMTKKTPKLHITGPLWGGSHHCLS